MNNRKSCYGSLGVLAISHAVVDTVSALMIFWGQRTHLISPDQFIPLVILHNALAFALQSPLGLVLDRWQRPRLAVCISLLMLAVSAVGFSYLPVAAVILAGIANAFFHVGGGTISFQYSPGRAAIPGIFVAPGDIGLVAGVLLGTYGVLHPMVTVPFVLALAVITYLIPMPEVNYERSGQAENGYLEAVVLLIILCIAIRSLIGSVMVFPWKADMHLLLALSVAIAVGKAAGGVLADRLGWLRVPVTGLLVSAPFLAFGANSPALAISGMLLFQMTMPVTLIALYKVLPGRPGFAFGLTCLALMIGLLPAYTPMRILLSRNEVVLTVIILSTIGLILGIKLLFKGAERKSDTAAYAPQLEEEII